MIMTMRSFAFLLVVLTIVVRGYTVPDRRKAFQTMATSCFLVLATPAVQALELCDPKANNCVRTTWTPPAGLSKADAIQGLRAALESYPQGGQSDIDGGGWTIAVDDLKGSGTARVEYKSSGKGNFAKFFNGGKPFVDDLKLEVGDTGIVQVKSQSRVGDSDFGVNGKRVNYLAALLSAKGWNAPALPK
jgi:Protein of unknown function (DUF1499)